MGEQYFNKISIEKRIAELRAREKECSVILKDYNFWEAIKGISDNKELYLKHIK